MSISLTQDQIDEVKPLVHKMLTLFNEHDVFIIEMAIISALGSVYGSMHSDDDEIDSIDIEAVDRSFERFIKMVKTATKDTNLGQFTVERDPNAPEMH